MTPRHHQRLALAALDRAWGQGHERAWVVLPPGAGKTYVGLETARRLLEGDEPFDQVVVFGPNTAISGQWVRQAGALGIDAGNDRDLGARLTALTYQSLAVFDADQETDDDGSELSLIGRLHPNGQALIDALTDAGRILLVLDECHHLLEVWGRLLAELLERLPAARVLALTATPPAAMTGDQAELVGELFGPTVFETTIPAVVREGDLVPYAELVWLTEPTAAERTWLAEGATRFAELVTRLTEPDFGSVPFLAWVDRRFVAHPDGTSRATSWASLARSWPELSDAALRLHHAGLLALPPGARPTEAHRRRPSAEDWMLLLDDWISGVLRDSVDPTDEEALDVVRRVLPSIGYALTSRGIRRGRTLVDRVLARSESKTLAAARIAALERDVLGEDLRLLVLCDHERATATLPADLDGVLDTASGSAFAVLDALVADHDDVLLVTGRTVAGAPGTLEALVEDIGQVDPGLAERLYFEPGPGGAVLAGPWNSRTWVPHVTRFFEAGRCRILVGTRALLGEGWDARSISGVVDLTTATSTTAVVQTRGRALRTDPDRPDKVAVNWSVVCVEGDHPRGDRDWQRLVRKHTGFYGVDEDGTVVDGVGHLHPGFSAFTHPDPDDFDTINAAMTLRTEDRGRIRERWRVGEPYDDLATRAVRIRSRRATLPTVEPVGRSGRLRPEQASAVVHDGALVMRAGPGPLRMRAGLLGAGVLAAVVALLVPPGWGWVVAALILLGSVAGLGIAAVARGRRMLALASTPPEIEQVAAAVADGLHLAGLTGAGVDHLALTVSSEGELRIRLERVGEEDADTFAAALEEALAPVEAPRYLVRRVEALPASDGWPGWRAAFAAGARGRVRCTAEVWHAVPGVLGVNRTRADAFAIAWDRWVGGTEVRYTGSADGAGILAAQRGSDPFDVTTVIRREWT